MAKTISAVVLAAGETTGMDKPKLTLPLEDKAIVRHVVDNLQRAKGNEIVVVVGADHVEVRNALSGTSATIEHNADYESGIGSSIRAGMTVASAEAEAYLIMPGDLPLVQTEQVDHLIDRFEEAHEGIVVPAYQRVPGFPVILDRRYRDRLMSLEAEDDVRTVLVDHPRDVLDIHFTTNVFVFDIDSEDDYEELLKRLGLEPRAPEVAATTEEPA